MYSSLLVNVVQFMNYLRPVQFIAHVSILNERLQLLDNKFLKLKAHSDQDNLRLKFDYISASTRLYDTIEVYRETFSRIWKLHKSLNHCFGLSILVIIFNALTSITFTLYFNISSSSENVTVQFIATPTLHTFHIFFLLIVMIFTCESSNVDELVNEILQLK